MKEIKNLLASYLDGNEKMIESWINAKLPAFGDKSAMELYNEDAEGNFDFIMGTFMRIFG